jgi:hypothetical protein
MSQIIEVSDTVEYGPVVRVFDRELADAFDDFVTENFYGFYDTKFAERVVEFYFGQFGSVERLKDVVQRFEAQHGSRTADDA